MTDQSLASIYAIMLNWNEFHHTVPCIDSLKKSNMPVHKILVLDQASEDGSGEKLSSLYEDDSQVEVILNDKNYGFSGGMNIGIQKALDLGAEFVFILNNDTIVDEDCLSHLYNVIAGNTSAAVAGPAIMYHCNPEKLWQVGGYFNKLKMGVSVPDKGKKYSEISHNTSEVSFLTGCALLVPRKTFQIVGFFDSSLFFYGDDVDFGLRIKKLGLKMLYVPAAKVWHKIDDITVDRTTPYVLYHLARSTVIVLRKNFSGIEKFYGIFLQFTLYTSFRIWQTVKGRRGWQSIISWLKGLIDGAITKLSS